jgi:HAD superfamily hydrolase (TIGR01509 family)
MWDMDGVIIDTLSMCLDAVNKIFSEEFKNFSPITEQQIISIFGFHHEEFFKELLLRLNLEFDDDKFQKIIDKYSLLRINAVYKFLPYALETINYFNKQNFIQVLVSSNREKLLKQITKNLGLAEKFNLIVGYDSADLNPKPSPSMYNYVLNFYQIKPTDAVIFEDSIIGITAAKNSGSFVCALLTSKENKIKIENLLQRTKSVILNDLGELYEL